MAAFQPEVRAALHGGLSAGGLSAAAEIDSPAALGHTTADLPQPLVIAGVRWPETAAFLDHATGYEIPIALLLAAEALDARHAAFRAGAAALLPWPIGSAALAHALESIRHGFRVVPGRAAAAPAAPAPLSARERELLELVAAGLGNKAIARRLGVSINTVKYHLASIFAKLDARTRAEAVSAAARRGELLL